MNKISYPNLLRANILCLLIENRVIFLELKGLVVRLIYSRSGRIRSCSCHEKGASRMSNRELILLDVETQRDFFVPGGACYTSQADPVRANVYSLIDWASQAKCPVLSTVLRFSGHQVGPMADVPHCIEDTTGEKKLSGSEVAPVGLPATIRCEPRQTRKGAAAAADSGAGVRWAGAATISSAMICTSFPDL